MKLPKITFISRTNSQTLWKAEFPSGPNRWGSSYRLATDHDSSAPSLFTWVKNKPVSEKVASRIMPSIQLALNKLKQKEQS